MRKLTLVLFILFAVLSKDLHAQDSSKLMQINYLNPSSYFVKDITVEGNEAIHSNLIVIFTNLTIGKKIAIPGREIQSAITNLWKKEFFSDVKIVATKIEGENIWLKVIVKERNRIYQYGIRGLGKSETKSLKEELGLSRNKIITESLIERTRQRALSYFRDKGYYSAEVEITTEPVEGKPNYELIRLLVKKGKKVKIKDIIFVGNDKISDKVLRKQLSKTKRKGTLLKSSKFKKEEYEIDKPQIVKKYNSLGYRDAKLVSDSVIQISDKRILIKMEISEGRQYYFGDITITGNTKYRTSFLMDTILEINRGDVYDQAKLEEKLFLDPKGYDISSVYMNNGYLFFNVTPIETRAIGDTVDLEIRIYEGDQARIGKVTVSGNTKTSDFVVLRELKTRPGEIFSRADIQRTMRELSQMGMFDPQSLGVNPMPNPIDGTVDIEYTVTERANDQIELSGGFGGYTKFVGTLGLSLNNFSARKLFKTKLWNPLPSGDGQRLSLRAQSNGTFFQSYNASFTEPWLGGKKPNSLTLGVYHTVNTNGLEKTHEDFGIRKTLGFSASLGKRLKWPDDYFVLRYGIGYQKIRSENFTFARLGGNTLSDGLSHNLNFTLALSRRETRGSFIFPTGGSDVGISVQFTPPYSSFDDQDYSLLSNEEKFRMIEYHKWSFNSAFYTQLDNKDDGKFVLATKFRFGFLGYYNKDIGYSPFERYNIGGSGLGATLVGTEFVSQRGYPDESISNAVSQDGTTIMDLFTLELRYAITTNPQSTVYLHTFLEAGNTWLDFRDFNPFVTRRAAGVGVRLFLPMFGLIGLDYAYGFDWKKVPQSDKPGQLHFFIGQQF